MSTVLAVVKAAHRLKDSAIRIVGAVRCGASTEAIEQEWLRLEQAFNELRQALEKKVSEG